MFCKKCVHRNFTKFIGNNCARVSFLIACNFINEETPAQVFSSDFFENSKNRLLLLIVLLIVIKSIQEPFTKTNAAVVLLTYQNQKLSHQVNFNTQETEAVAQRCFVKKVFLVI